MEIQENLKVKYPVAKAADKKGFSLSALWRLAVKDIKFIPYTTFIAISVGRLRNKDFEKWFIKKGFGKDLRRAQREHKAKKKGNSK